MAAIRERRQDCRPATQATDVKKQRADPKKPPDLSHIRQILVDPFAPGDHKVWELGNALIVNEKTWEYIRYRMQSTFALDALTKRGITVHNRPGAFNKFRTHLVPEGDQRWH